MPLKTAEHVEGTLVPALERTWVAQRRSGHVETSLAVSIRITAPSGTRHGTPAGEAAGAVLTALAPVLRRSDGTFVPLERRPPPRGLDGVRFTAVVEPGSYLLCDAARHRSRSVLGLPPRPIQIEPGATTRTFRIVERSTPFFRVGSTLVPFARRREHLAAVLLDRDVDANALTRLEETLGEVGYHPVIDLTRPARRSSGSPTAPGPGSATATGPAPAGHSLGAGGGDDALVAEFAARPDRTPTGLEQHPAVAVDALIRASATIARWSGLAPHMVRLGRLVVSGHGRVVLDNELVLGFVDTVERDDALRYLRGGGGRLLEDLSEWNEGGLVYVVRFDDAAPQQALALAERWLERGILHWVEPNLVDA